MKKTMMSMISVLVFLVFFCTAYAEENAFFSIIRQHLLTDEENTSILSKEKISAMIEDLAQIGYPVSESEFKDEEYTYDVALDILESILGNYFDWTIEEKHQFDQLMVECGELSYCFNLLPGDGEISQEDALRIALNEISSRFNLDPSLLDNPSAIYVSYYIADHSVCGGMWRFGVELQNQMNFSVEVTDGSVTRCEKNIVIDDLEEEYNSLCEQRGAFFKWSLQEKMEFANSLPLKLAKAKKKDALLRSVVELEAIAAYGFCLPADEAISQEEALSLAAAAMEDEFHISNWNETYYSFFFRKDVGYVWRVIFWGTEDEQYTSVVVDMQALTGELLSMKTNGKTLSEYIPYVERL